MKAPRYTSIRRIILGAMILTPAIPFMLILVIGFFYFNVSLESTTLSTIERIVLDHGRMIDTFLRERKNDLDFILRSNGYEDISTPDNLKNLFHLLQQESKAFIDIGIFNEAGDHVAYIGPFSLEGKNYQSAPWFKEVTRKGIYISDVFLGYRQVPHFIIALMRDAGQQKWIVRATIDTKLFNDLVEAVQIGKTGEAYLVNANGILQSQQRSNGHLMEKDPGFPGVPSAVGSVQTFIPQGRGHQGFIYATTRLVEKDWILVVRQEKADAFEALRAAGYRILITALIGGMLIITTALFLSKFIVHKMEKNRQGKGRARAATRAGQPAGGIGRNVRRICP